VTWHYSGDSVVIDGVALNALPNAVFPVFIPPPYMTTITVPRAYGHYTGDDHAFMRPGTCSNARSRRRSRERTRTGSA
jgi:hypothetical protein